MLISEFQLFNLHQLATFSHTIYMPFLPNDSHLKVQCLKYAHTHFRALFNAPDALRKLRLLYCVIK